MEKSPYSQKEEEILKFWRENNIFEKSISERPEDKPYVFYDGPPFATGLPHYGHILSSVTKDLYPRFWTMKGYRVRRRWGWDCHGLPIETLVEKELGISGKKQIEEKGIGVFNQTARDMVLSYANQWEEMVDRIGRWVEFTDSYKTMDSTYMESVWWALKSIWDKGLIYEGRKVLMYCPRCETPVSNAEIQMDNSYKDVEEESVYVKFKLKPNQKFKSYETGDSAYMLAWTTTPWTLPANVALAVGKDIDYSAIRIKGETGLIILASNLIEKVFKDLEIEMVHDDLKGSDIEGLFYEPLFEIPAVNDLPNKAWYVATADFVTTDDGAGVVHTAVIYGEDDYALGLNLDLPQVPLLDSAARYNKEAPEFLQGKYIKDAEPEIIADLEDRKLLFKKEKYAHSYPYCWRCDSPLIYNAISAWFIDIQKIKARMIELNENINWFPKYLKEGRFKNILESAPDWNISRNRYWATPLPFFKCENEQCDHRVCIGSLAELKEKSDNFSDIYHSDLIDEVDLHKPYVDEIILTCEKCNSKMHRIPEVVDCWVESGSMPFAEFHYPFENEEEFKGRFPGQFVGEYIAQTRAWFYYMHVMAVLLFDNVSYENVVATGTILSDKGEKLSKSKKNYPDPWATIDRYGADALRFYLMNSVVMQADNLFFNEKDLREIYNKVINTTSNILSFYKIYENDFSSTDFEYGNLSVLDKYVLSRMESTKQNVTKYLEGYDSVKATREIRALIEDISLWWLRRSRERFRTQTDDAKNAFAVLGYIVKNLSLILAPVVPFISEELYRAVSSQTDPVSVHLEVWPQVKTEYISNSIEKDMQQARAIVEMGHSIRSRCAIKVRQPIASVWWSAKFDNDSDDITEIVLAELNIEEFDQKENFKKLETNLENDLEVAIDVELDERLLELGNLREFTRAIQDRRKKMGLKPKDKIKLFIKTDGLEGFIEKNKDKISADTNISSIESLVDTEDSNTIELSRGKAYFKLGE